VPHFIIIKENDSPDITALKTTINEMIEAFCASTGLNPGDPVTQKQIRKRPNFKEFISDSPQGTGDKNSYIRTSDNNWKPK